MRCPKCGVTLAAEETITAIHGLLLCNECASNTYSEYELQTASDEIIPSDIGLKKKGRRYDTGTIARFYFR